MPAPQIYDTITDRKVRAAFFRRLEEELAGDFTAEVATEFRSNQEIETYPWLSATPQMREWIGGRQIKQLRENNLTVRNRKFEVTLGFSLDDMRRDKVGMVDVRVGELAERAAKHVPKLLSEFIDNGSGTTKGKAWDGKSFFNSSHVIKGTNNNSSTINNDISVTVTSLPVTTTGTATDPSVAAMALIIRRGIRQMLGFTDEEQEPLNDGARSFLVMAPLELADVVDAAVTNTTLGDDGPNPLLAGNRGRGAYSIFSRTNTRLTGAQSIYIFRTDAMARAMINQIEVPLTAQMLGPESEYAKKEDEALFMAKRVGNVGYGDFTRAVRVTTA